MIVVLVDDLGWTDAGALGSDLYATPNLDRFAREGTRFTTAYSACCVCSPTRAALLTGKAPARLHLTDWIPGHDRKNAPLKIPDWTRRLPLEEETLAEALGGAGYAVGMIGKWHLGETPEAQGFPLNLGGDHRGQPPSYFSPYGLPKLPDGPPGEYLTDREAAEACRFIEANRDRPFFLYLPHYAVHTPLQPKPDLREKYRGRGTRHRNPDYAAMIDSMDAAFGRVLETLDTLDLTRRTLVIFTSDNGGLELNGVTENAPLREGKGSAYEGGVRVPLIVRGPGVRRGTLCAEPVITMDLHATVRQTAGLPPRTPDGRSLTPLLREPASSLDRDALFWHYPHYHPGGATPHGAVRIGDWRLVEFFEDGRLELYNLKDDPGETRNLEPERPEVAARFHGRLRDWRAEVGAQMPSN